MNAPIGTPQRGIATARITARRRLAVSAVALGLWATGVAWLLSHAVFVPEGAFGPRYREIDPWLLALHGGLGSLALWLFGLLWGVHVVNGWAQGRRRRSGGLLVGLVLLLAATGCLLYYVGDETARIWVSRMHWLAGLAGALAFPAHRYAGRRARASARRPAGPFTPGAAAPPPPPPPPG